jgi:hypothetical protein
MAIPTEPANASFVVWYDPYAEPYAVYFRSDKHGWDGGERWFNADQHHNGGTEPSTWADLCDEMSSHCGPFRLRPGVAVR